MICQSLLFRKIRKIIIDLSFAELTQRVQRLKGVNTLVIQGRQLPLLPVCFPEHQINV